jgi:hypothetical protein
MARLRQRLIAVVTALRSDIDAGNTRECQQAVEDLSESFLELENSDVPANYIVRLRQSQSALRKAVLRVYHIQREEFLPSAYAMIVSLVVIILAVEEVEAQAEEVEELLSDVEEQEGDVTEVADLADRPSSAARTDR